MREAKKDRMEVFFGKRLISIKFFLWYEMEKMRFAMKLQKKIYNFVSENRDMQVMALYFPFL